MQLELEINFRNNLVYSFSFFPFLIATLFLYHYFFTGIYLQGDLNINDLFIHTKTLEKFGPKSFCITVLGEGTKIFKHISSRFILSFASCKNCLVIDDQLRILPISSQSHKIEALPPKTKVRKGSSLNLFLILSEFKRIS